ncbi:hypothetical protein [Nostoc sp.]|uniref:hypothetical protein n=1 Tax=Nostoc sp. TaxID=1180 RepID=UPI002FFB8BBA
MSYSRRSLHICRARASRFTVLLLQKLKSSRTGKGKPVMAERISGVSCWRIDQ